jgi:hypothetical protein
MKKPVGEIKSNNMKGIFSKNVILYITSRIANRLNESSSEEVVSIQAVNYIYD